VLRTTLIGSLLDAARYNFARGAAELALFEVGAVYLAGDPAPAAPGDGQPGGRLPHEHRALGVLLSGRIAPRSWRGDQPPADMFAAKALLEALAATLRVPQLEVEPALQPFLHPGRTAAVTVEGDAVGWLGELHPLVASAWDLEGGAAFEVDLDRLLAAVPTTIAYEDLIGYPALRQDIAVIVADEVPAAAVLAVVRRAAGSLLDSVRVFDLYRGAQLGEGRKSLALALSFRAAERTLTDEDVAPLRTAIVAALRDEVGGQLRA
jgi:phenylalanyl-tRNA synthetase beta chain